MKYLILCCTVLINSVIYSQERGEFLENEINLNDTEINKTRIEKRGDLGGQNVQNAQNYKSNKNWDYNTQTEIFLRVLDDGRYTVEVDNQLISNSIGKFRFFDLNPGLNTLKIYKNDLLVYRFKLLTRENSRAILDYSHNDGLYLVDVLKLNKHSQIAGQWEDSWEPVFNNKSHQWGNHNIMNSKEFNSYISAIKRESFDDDKTNFILSTSKGVFFTAEQVKDIIKTFSFEDDKLNIAKKLSYKIIDRKNLYKIYDAFTFSNSKEELKDYIINSK